jgi:hypothetical protein
MKLLKTIERLIEESEREYLESLENNDNPKIIERAEKNYFDSLEILKKFNALNGYKRR